MIPSSRRIIYLPHAPELGTPLWPSGPYPNPPRAHDIQNGLDQLDPVQKDIVERRFWMGHTLARISRSHGVPEAQTRRELCRALQQLRRRLSSDPGIIREPRCKLCAHPERAAIDRLLQSKPPKGTWRGYLKNLRERFGITGLPAKALDAHLNLHILPEENTHDYAGTGSR